MRMFITIVLGAILLAACGKANPERPPAKSSEGDNRTPLRCVKCSYVEEKGSRRISGRIQNDSRGEVRDAVLNIDFKDSKGDTVSRQENIPLPVGDAIAPGLSEQFTVNTPSGGQNITHVILYLRDSKTGEQLSAPTTLLLVVSLE